MFRNPKYLFYKGIRTNSNYIKITYKGCGLKCQIKPFDNSVFYLMLSQTDLYGLIMGESFTHLFLINLTILKDILENRL